MATPTFQTNKTIAENYEISASTSPSSAQLLTFPKTNNGIPAEGQEVIIYAKTADIIFKFSPSSSVAADATVTSNKLASGNFKVPAGAIFSMRLTGDQTYVSVVTASGTGTASIYLTTPQV